MGSIPTCLAPGRPLPSKGYPPCSSAVTRSKRCRPPTSSRSKTSTRRSAASRPKSRGCVKNLASTLTRNERFALVDRGEAELTLTDQANLLSLSRRSLYYQPVPPSAEEVAIKHAIDRIYTDQPAYGSRRIAVALQEDYQLVVNRKAVQRHMREMGIASISPGPNLSQRNREHQVYPYLLRGVTAAYPNHVWAIDITYIPLLLEDEVQITMDGKGRALDTIFTERLRPSVNYQEVFLRDSGKPREARF